MALQTKKLVDLGAPLAQRLHRHAARTHMPMTVIIRLALDRYLKAKERSKRSIKGGRQ